MSATENQQVNPSSAESKPSGDVVYERAQKRAKQLRELISHVTIYVLIIGGLALINFLTVTVSGEWGEAKIGAGWWFVWPMVGWGIGLAIHAAAVLGIGVNLDVWEQHKAEELARKWREEDRQSK